MPDANITQDFDDQFRSYRHPCYHRLHEGASCENSRRTLSGQWAQPQPLTGEKHYKSKACNHISVLQLYRYSEEHHAHLFAFPGSRSGE